MRRSTPVSWEQLRVGALVLVGLVLLAVGIFLVGRVGHVFGHRYELVTLMRSGSGLVPGSAVQLAGQNVGQVARIDLIPPERRAEEEASVAVWLAVNREVQEQIRADSRARLRTQGLLGDRVIDIQPGSPQARILDEGDTIPSAEPLDYQEILEQASGAITGLRDLTRRLEELTQRLLAGEGSLGRLVVDETLYRRLADLSGSLADVLEQAESGQGTLGQLLTDRRLYERMVSVTASLDSLTAGLAAGRGTLGRMVTSDSLYRELTGTTRQFNALLDSLRRGQGTAGRLVTDDALYEELLRTLTDLNAVLEDVRQKPRRYIPPIEVF